MLAALVVFVLDQIRPRYGISWVITVVAGVIAWGLVAYSRLRLPTIVNLLSWNNPNLNQIGHLSLLLDYKSWPYALALITIFLAMIFTDAARTHLDGSPRAWIASLLITALGLLAIQSGTSLTMMIAWVVVDFLQLFHLLRLQETPQFNTRIVVSYGVRLASVLLLFLGTMLGWASHGDFDLTAMPKTAGFVFLLAVALRLGVIPLNLPFLKEPILRRGAGNILRLTPVAASLTLLARLPEEALLPTNHWKTLLMGLLSLAALYAASRWLAAIDEIEGRQYWIIAWASFATVSVLNGVPQASVPWGMALLLSGSLLFLYYPRIQRINFLLLFGLFGLLGLPYTLTASGWYGLVGSGFNLWSFLLLIAHGIMILGYLEHALKPGSEASGLETWARVVFPLGLIFIIQAIFSLALIGWPGAFTPGVWWVALISNILILIAMILIRRFGVKPPYFHLPSSGKIKQASDWLLPRIEPVFRLEWLYNIVWKLYYFLGQILKLFSSLLESEGGFLWTVLILVLLISILSGGGVN